MQLPVSIAWCCNPPELLQHQVIQILKHSIILESINLYLLRCVHTTQTSNTVVESSRTSHNVRVWKRQTTTTDQLLLLLLLSLLSSNLRLLLQLLLLKLLLILILAILACLIQPQHWHTIHSLLNLILSTSTLDHTLFHLLHLLLDTLDIHQIID